jgi:hypothetical protein
MTDFRSSLDEKGRMKGPAAKLLFINEIQGWRRRDFGFGPAGHGGKTALGFSWVWLSGVRVRRFGNVGTVGDGGIEA